MSSVELYSEGQNSVEFLVVRKMWRRRPCDMCAALFKLLQIHQNPDSDVLVSMERRIVGLPDDVKIGRNDRQWASEIIRECRTLCVVH